MKEASAMTEACGRTNEQGGNADTSDAYRPPLRAPSQDVTMRWAERLRVKASLQSLSVAFLLGIWVARRP